jgi:hypothetical protein
MIGAAQVRIDDQIQETQQQIGLEETSSAGIPSPAQGMWLSIQKLRDGDRVEAQLDSLRQFRWHLSLVRAASQSDVQAFERVYGADEQP